jgi:hypothetical protein
MLSICRPGDAGLRRRSVLATFRAAQPALAGHRAQFTVRRGIYRAGRYIRFTHMATLAALSLDRDAPWLALLHSTCTGAIQCSHDKNDLAALHCVPPAQ